MEKFILWFTSISCVIALVILVGITRFGWFERFLDLLDKVLNGVEKK
jgi:hypothetical protein